MEKEIDLSVETLRKGGILMYPTDTIWGIGCDATDEKAVSKVYDLKQRSESKSLVILVDSIEMLKAYVKEIPDIVMRFLNDNSKPTTVIYHQHKGLAPNVIADDGTIAVRIPKDFFCRKLINRFGKPIVSSSANLSGKPFPSNFDQIESSLLNKADYIVNLSQSKMQNAASQIIKVNDLGKIEFLRK